MRPARTPEASEEVSEELEETVAALDEANPTIDPTPEEYRDFTRPAHRTIVRRLVSDAIAASGLPEEVRNGMESAFSVSSTIRWAGSTRQIFTRVRIGYGGDWISSRANQRIDMDRVLAALREHAERLIAMRATRQTEAERSRARRERLTEMRTELGFGDRYSSRNITLDINSDETYQVSFRLDVPEERVRGIIALLKGIAEL